MTGSRPRTRSAFQPVLVVSERLKRSHGTTRAARVGRRARASAARASFRHRQPEARP